MPKTLPEFEMNSRMPRKEPMLGIPAAMKAQSARMNALKKAMGK